MRKFLAVAFFALLSFTPLSLVVETPQLAVRMAANISDQGGILVSGGRILEYELNTTVPQNTPYQEAMVSAQVVEDTEGNLIARIYESSPKAPYTYSVFSSVVSHARSTSSIPESYIVPLDLQRYLLPSKTVQSQDPKIRELALVITANSSSAFEAVSRLAIWVHNYVEYDETEAGQQRDALWVLENKRGVCVEYTTLFMALAKSAGIPVRYVAGYTYSGKYSGWLGHSWAEAYVGEWIPVDPTWLEVGHLGATYIELRKSSGTTLDKSVSALVSPSTATIKLEGDGGSFLGKAAENIKVCDTCIEFGNRSADFELIAAAPSVRGDGKNLVILRMAPSDYKVANFDLQTCSGQDFIKIQGSTARDAVLEKGKEENLVWEVEVGKPTADNMIYTCPFTLNSALYEAREAEVKVDSRAPTQMQFEAWVASSKIPANETQRVQIKAGWTGEFGVVGEGFFQKVEVRAGETKTVEVAPERRGKNYVYVYSPSGNYMKLDYEVSEYSPVRIGRIGVPEVIYEGSLVPVRIEFAAATDTPVQAKVTVRFGTSIATVQHTPVGKDSAQIAVRAPSAGKQTLVVEMDSGGVKQTEAFDISVLTQPRVSISEFKSTYEAGLASVSMVFKIDGDASGIKATIGGEPVSITWGSGGVEGAARVPYGAHDVEISWRDSEGNLYSSTETIGIEEPSGVLFELPAQKEEGKLPCLPAAIFALAAGGLFLRHDSWV
jgi:hypothetical protein